MTRKACLAIGVSYLLPSTPTAARFAYLDGAVLAARAIGDWAARSGFGAPNIRVVDDGINADNPVTRARVQQAVNELFAPGAERVEQLILAFCGHGLTDANIGSISWLFSDSLSEKYRVVAERFHEELLLHGVKRITLISDACREAPKGLDLMRLDAVRGIVVKGTAQVDSPMFDRLVSCQDGQLGYMVSDKMSAAPGKCVFSGVITDTLWGLEPSAIVDGQITTTTLSKCVRARTTERAREYSLKLNPQCQVDPEPALLYSTTGAPPVPDNLQPWPASGKPAPLGEMLLEADAADFADNQLERWLLPRNLPRDVESVLRPLNVSRRQLKKDVMPWLQKVTGARRFLDEMQALKSPGEANLIIGGDSIRLWSQEPVRCLETSSDLRRYQVPGDQPERPLLAELADGTFTPVVAYDGLYAFVASSHSGELYQSYGHHSEPDRFQQMFDTINLFVTGQLQINDVTSLTSELWQQPRPDPLLGVLCAYFYRALADYDSIRRIAWFYAVNNQPVPFDIALLGTLEVTRTATGELWADIPAIKPARSDTQGLSESFTQGCAAIRARIAGHCPWFGLGWDYVNEPRSQSALLVEGLEDYASDVPRSGLTTLSSDAGHKLAAAWHLKPR